ncbi:uncharacterized protein CIMG_11395 [Coccidioides immitis RS]|uniref:Uncharacterized protein n=1 Tax=Coccidioides immitis (strain RS) TaxID=246410 RepID=A0A0D8JV55_COCIM|nr:uncharacterized protein CIMG_11395 [Coccidioides immitis RS]KJF61039.1 hypothetical protein CIMG_11395 [Coccidioides immitis RS]
MDFIRGKGFEKRVIPMFAPETSSDKPSEKAASEVKLITPYPNGMYMFNLRGLTSLFLFCTSPYQDHIRRKNTGGRGARWLVPPTIVSLWNGGGQAFVFISAILISRNREGAAQFRPQWCKYVGEDWRQARGTIHGAQAVVGKFRLPGDPVSVLGLRGKNSKIQRITGQAAPAIHGIRLLQSHRR